MMKINDVFVKIYYITLLLYLQWLRMLVMSVFPKICIGSTSLMKILLQKIIKSFCHLQSDWSRATIILFLAFKHVFI